MSEIYLIGGGISGEYSEFVGFCKMFIVKSFSTSVSVSKWLAMFLFLAMNLSILSVCRFSPIERCSKWLNTQP